MTNAIALALVFVVVAAAVVALAWRLGSSSPSGVRDDVGDAWLAEVHELIPEGRRIVDRATQSQLADESVPLCATAEELSGALDGLTQRLAELGPRAPTSMDARVCRSLAVRARALGNALDAVGTGHAGENPTSTLVLREKEFEVALSDLAEHVDLL